MNRLKALDEAILECEEKVHFAAESLGEYQFEEIKGGVDLYEAQLKSLGLTLFLLKRARREIIMPEYEKITKE